MGMAHIEGESLSDLVERGRKRKVEQDEKKRKVQMPVRRTIMAVDVLRGYAATSWAKLERGISPTEGWEKWLEFVGAEGSQRCILRPGKGKVGTVTGVGVTKTFEDRIRDHIFHNKVEYLIWAGDGAILDYIREDAGWIRPRGRAVKKVTKLPMSVEIEVARMAKFRCETALNALVRVTRKGSWLEIDEMFGRTDAE